jgi:hypothetical protein
MDALGEVVVASGNYLKSSQSMNSECAAVCQTGQETYLDDLITRKLQLGNVLGIARHEIAVENAKDALMGNNQKIVLFALEFQDDGLKSNSEIVV